MSEKQELDGIVVQHSHDTFLVQTPIGTINAKLSGRIRKNCIRICAQDRVRVEVDGFDMTKGRIITRLK